MLTKQEVKAYKAILGNDYSKNVLAYFDLMEYTKPSGEKYSAQDLRNFFWRRYDQSLHIKVLEAVEHYKAKKKVLAEEIEARKARLFEDE